MNLERVIISGGGTGGHIFPAIAIADEIKRRHPNAEILFIGAIGKMEMEKVPSAGYRIEGLPIAGLKRKLSLSNFLLPFKVFKSMWMARSIVLKFHPQVVIGVGGYASGPTLKAAAMLKIPTLVQEQNSFPGKTNKLLSKNVNKLCVAYEGLEKYFPKEKIVLTGNPVRSEVVKIEGKREEAFGYYNLDNSKKTILIIGGSLGARTLNDSVLESFQSIIESDIQILWQSGKLYYNQLVEELKTRISSNNIKLVQFIDRMDLAYAAADIIISRAGAISVSELCLVKKPVILVPSPNVAEDHQTKNAMSLVEKDAAILVRDMDAKLLLFPTAFDLLKDSDKMNYLSSQMAQFGKPRATESIVDEIEKLLDLNE